MVWIIAICGQVSPFAGLYLINTKGGHACYFDFDILIELEVFLKMLNAAKI